MEFFLGIDLGASALKACLVDEAGQSHAVARAPYATQNPEIGHSEQDPQDWRKAMQKALANLRETHADAFAGIKAVSFSGGAHIGVLCDAADRPLRPAIMWSDQRAHEEAAALAAAAKVEKLAGNTPNATWTLPQLIWLKAHEPHHIAATQKLFFAKDWLAAQLTGAHVSDKSEAVGSLMADHNGDWHDELTGMSGLKGEAFPALVESGADIGPIKSAAAADFGLPATAKVYQGAIDTSMEWLCAAPPNSPPAKTPDNEMATLKLASAGVISFATQNPTRFAPVSYYPHILDGLSYHAAGMSDCMGAIDFIRQNMTPHLSAAAFEEAAQSAAAGAEGLFFYPYLSGARAPFWDASLTAEMRGLTRGHGQNAIARAAYEGVGHVLTAIWHDMTAKLGHRPQALQILGGGGQSDFFCQILADMLDVPLYRGHETDCAYASALFAAAIFRGENPADKARAAYRSQGEFTPDKTASAVYASFHQAFMARHA
jgi:xylulokinase